MSNANISKIARQIEGQKPGVSPTLETGAGESAPEPEKGPQKKPAEKTESKGDRAQLMRDFAHLRDKEGLSFDPDLHKWDSDKAAPDVTPAGVLKRKPGRRAKRRAASSSSYIPPETGPAAGAEAAAGEQPVTEADQCRTSAKVAASMWFNLLTMAFGEDAQPSSAYREREQLEAALQEHFHEHGRWSVPTWLGVAQVMGAHLGRVAGSEQAQERARSMGERFRGLVEWARGMKRSEKPEPAPESEAVPSRQARG